MSSSKDDYNSYTFKELIVRFIKISSIYGGFKFIAQFGSFFIIPIYWYYLSPEDYGILGLTAVLQGILTPLMSLGLHGSLERFYYEWSEDERKYKIGVLWILKIIISLLIVFTIEYYSQRIFPYLFSQVPYDPYFRIILATTFFTSLSFFPFTILRITEKSKVYGIISIFTFLLNAVINILLLSIFKLKVLGILLGGLISSGIIGLFWIVWMLNKIKINFNLYSIKAEILYSLPSLPIGIFDSVGNNFDRYLLEKYLGLKQLGFYNISNRFGAYFNQINSSFKTAWFPMVYKMMIQRKNFKDVLPSLSLFYFFILTIFAISASLLLKEVIYIIGKDKFIEAYKFVPLFILIYLIRNFGTVWGRGLDLAKKPIYTLYSTIPGVALGIALLYLWVPKYGTYGAIGALLVTSFIKTSIFVFLAHKLYPRQFLSKQIFLICVLLGFIFFIGFNYEYDKILSSILFKSMLIVIYMIIGSFITFGYQNVIKQVSKVSVNLFTLVTVNRNKP